MWVSASTTLTASSASVISLPFLPELSAEPLRLDVTAGRYLQPGSAGTPCCTVRSPFLFEFPPAFLREVPVGFDPGRRHDDRLRADRGRRDHVGRHPGGPIQ